MRILLTNDDGYDAPGLLALYRAVRGLPDVEIDVIAPAEPQSGKGHTVSRAIRCRRRELPEIGGITTVEGSPADCIRAALVLEGHPRPDRVIAGINHGGNLGADVYYSGTVAAAREAAFFGIPAVAVSQVVVRGIPDDWPRTTREAAAVLAALVRPDAPPPPHADAALHDRTRRALTDADAPFRPGEPPCWNVNLPGLPAGTATGGVRVVSVSRDPMPLDYQCTREDDGTWHLENVARYLDRKVTANTDVAVAFAGQVAISPMRL